MPKHLSSIDKGPLPYRYIVVDGNNVAYKYTGMPHSKWTTSDGQRSGVFAGMLTYLRYLVKTYGEPGTQVIYCWDGPESSTLRKSMQKDYKANRDHSSDGYIFKQLEAFSALLAHYGYMSLQGPAEADDYAYAVVRRCKGARVLLVSEDKDWEQLLGPKVHIWKPRADLLMTEPLEYDFVVYRTLMGDSVDNIKSARVCHEDEARKLAMRYSSVEEMVKREAHLLSHAEELTGRARLFRLYDCDITIEPRAPANPDGIRATLALWDIAKNQPERREAFVW